MNWNVILYIVINGFFFLPKYVWNCFSFEKTVDFKFYGMKFSSVITLMESSVPRFKVDTFPERNTYFG